MSEATMGIVTKSARTGADETLSVASWPELSNLVRQINGNDVADIMVTVPWGTMGIVGNPDGVFLVWVRPNGSTEFDALGGSSRPDTDEVYFVRGGTTIDAPAATYLTLDQALAAARAFWLDHALAPELAWTDEPVPYHLPLLE